MKLKIVIKAKQIINMNIADNIVINFYAILCQNPISSYGFPADPRRGYQYIVYVR